MSEIVICDVTYELTDEPKHGVVRKVRNERQSSLKHFLSQFKDELDMNGDIDKELQKIMSAHPSEAIEFGYSEMEFKNRATISLALNHYFGEEDFDNLTETEIEDIYFKCEETLGGDVDHFFGELEKKSNRKSNATTPERKK